jgi:hypothetical protein
MRTLLFTISLFILAVFNTPAISFAQAGVFDSNDFSLKVNPEYPVAFESVSMSVSSYLFDVNTSQISWVVDGKVAKSGIGLTTHSIFAKNIGQSTLVTVKIFADGATLTKSVAIKPTSVDVFFESASGYTPPFYKGRALPTKDSQIKIVALPILESNATSINPSGFSYNWKKGESALQGSSGYNKNSLTYFADYLNTVENIELSVSNPLTGYSAKKKMTIPLFEPKILIYENHPLRGIRFERSLNNSINIGSGEKTLLVEPYFINAIGPTSSYLNYTWKINDQTIPTPNRKNQLVVRNGGQEGTSKISLEIENITKLFEKVSASLLITLTK